MNRWCDVYKTLELVGCSFSDFLFHIWLWGVLSIVSEMVGFNVLKQHGVWGYLTTIPILLPHLFFLASLTMSNNKTFLMKSKGLSRNKTSCGGFRCYFMGNLWVKVTQPEYGGDFFIVTNFPASTMTYAISLFDGSLNCTLLFCYFHLVIRFRLST